MGQRKKFKNIVVQEENTHNDVDSSVSAPIMLKVHATGKKDLLDIIKLEYDFINTLFDSIDIAGIKSHGRKAEEDEETEDIPLLDIPEKKIFKKQGQKKGATQSSAKKSFPHTIEGLEKELEELKGNPTTYQTKLRKKGLQSRLIKKKRKEGLKLRKVTVKQGKKLAGNGIGKQKPVFNNNGHVVSNKFDFADSDSKKETKRKIGIGDQALSNQAESKDDKSEILTKKNTLENSSEHNGQKSTHQGPFFNKDNKMVFSRVLMPDSNKRNKKKNDNNPKKLLEKIKENSKMISELKNENKEKATLLEEKHKWVAALKRASGEKVKDDPELLKKSIMREKNKKARSTKKWQARIDKVQKERDEKQKKRTENIQARKNEKKKRKMKSAIKKGRIVPM